MKSPTIKVQLPKKLHWVFSGQARYRGAHGGRGSGKSMGFALMCLLRGMERPMRILCAREIQTTIRDSVHRELVSAIDKFGLEDFYNYGTSYVQGTNGTEFLFKGLRHNYKEIKSTSGVNICWIEEAEAVSEDSWRVLIPTIREEGSEIWATWNPEDPESPVQVRLVDNPPDNARVVAMNWRDNPWFPDVLEEERQHDLKTMDIHLYNHVWEGECITRTGLEIYYNFDKKTHVSDEVEQDQNLPILWSHDFNIADGKPMSSCLCQIKKGEDHEGNKRTELHIFDEIVIETADTHTVIDEFKERYGKDNVIIYGDPAGQARDTRSKMTDYMILKEQGFKKQKVAKAHPPIRDRHNAVNALLKNASGDVRVKIHPRCKTLIKGLQTVKLKQGSQYLEEETYPQHITTALGYLICQEFPIRKREIKPIPSLVRMG
jgi:PBSX family phage terminase large subunit